MVKILLEAKINFQYKYYIALHSGKQKVDSTLLSIYIELKQIGEIIHSTIAFSAVAHAVQAI